MNRIDLNTLAQFAVVARHLNFRRAAAELAIAPSTLSERIRELEGKMGQRLINRTTRSAALTEAGQALLERTRAALAVLEDAAEGIGAGAGVAALSGRLRINGPRPAIELRLMPLVTSFLALHPAVRIELISQAEFVDVVAEGFDAGLRYDDTLAQDMIAVRLGAAQRMIIVGSPAYLAQHGTPRHPDDLAAHDCIGHVFARGNILPWSLHRGAQAVEFTPRDRLLVNEVGVAIMAARAHRGLVYTFDEYVAGDLAAGLLVPVLEDWTPPFAGPLLYFPERRLMPPVLRAFVDHVKHELRKLPAQTHA